MKAKWKIEEWEGPISGHTYYRVYKAGWFGWWDRHPPLFNTKESAEEYIQKNLKTPQKWYYDENGVEDHSRNR